MEERGSRPDVEVLDDGAIAVRTAQGTLVISQQAGQATHRSGSSSSEDDHRQEFRQRFRELLEELRVILPGLQVLFAFLLMAPFSSRFPELDRTGLIGFAIALGASGLGSLALLAPTVYHRIDRRRDRKQRLQASIGFQVAGALLAGVGICAGTFVITRFVYGPPAGTWSASALAVFLVVAWLITPIVRRR